MAVIDQFLDFAQQYNAPDTYAWYQQRLQVFALLLSFSTAVHSSGAHRVTDLLKVVGILKR